MDIFKKAVIFMGWTQIIWGIGLIVIGLNGLDFIIGILFIIMGCSTLEFLRE